MSSNYNEEKMDTDEIYYPVSPDLGVPLTPDYSDYIAPSAGRLNISSNLFDQARINEITKQSYDEQRKLSRLDKTQRVEILQGLFNFLEQKGDLSVPDIVKNDVVDIVANILRYPDVLPAVPGLPSNLEGEIRIQNVCAACKTAAATTQTIIKSPAGGFERIEICDQFDCFAKYIKELDEISAAEINQGEINRNLFYLNLKAKNFQVDLASQADLLVSPEPQKVKLFLKQSIDLIFQLYKRIIEDPLKQSKRTMVALEQAEKVDDPKDQLKALISSDRFQSLLKSLNQPVRYATSEQDVRKEQERRKHNMLTLFDLSNWNKFYTPENVSQYLEQVKSTSLGRETIIKYVDELLKQLEQTNQLVGRNKASLKLLALKQMVYFLLMHKFTGWLENQGQPECYIPILVANKNAHTISEMYRDYISQSSQLSQSSLTPCEQLNELMNDQNFFIDMKHFLKIEALLEETVQLNDQLEANLRSTLHTLPGCNNQVTQDQALNWMLTKLNTTNTDHVLTSTFNFRFDVLQPFIAQHTSCIQNTQITQLFEKEAAFLKLKNAFVVLGVVLFGYNGPVFQGNTWTPVLNMLYSDDKLSPQDVQDRFVFVLEILEDQLQIDIFSNKWSNVMQRDLGSLQLSTSVDLTAKLLEVYNTRQSRPSFEQAKKTFQNLMKLVQVVSSFAPQESATNRLHSFQELPFKPSAELQVIESIDSSVLDRIMFQRNNRVHQVIAAVTARNVDFETLAKLAERLSTVERNVFQSFYEVYTKQPLEVDVGQNIFDALRAGHPSGTRVKHHYDVAIQQLKVMYKKNNNMWLSYLFYMLANMKVLNKQVDIARTMAPGAAKTKLESILIYIRLFMSENFKQKLLVARNIDFWNKLSSKIKAHYMGTAYEALSLNDLVQLYVPDNQITLTGEASQLIMNVFFTFVEALNVKLVGRTQPMQNVQYNDKNVMISAVTNVPQATVTSYEQVQLASKLNNVVKQIETQLAKQFGVQTFGRTITWGEWKKSGEKGVSRGIAGPVATIKNTALESLTDFDRIEQPALLKMTTQQIVSSVPPALAGTIELGEVLSEDQATMLQQEAAEQALKDTGITYDQLNAILALQSRILMNVRRLQQTMGLKFEQFRQILQGYLAAPTNEDVDQELQELQSALTGLAEQNLGEEKLQTMSDEAIEQMAADIQILVQRMSEIKATVQANRSILNFTVDRNNLIGRLLFAIVHQVPLNVVDQYLRFKREYFEMSMSHALIDNVLSSLFERSIYSSDAAKLQANLTKFGLSRSDYQALRDYMTLKKEILGTERSIQKDLQTAFKQVLQSQEYNKAVRLADVDLDEVVLSVLKSLNKANLFSLFQAQKTKFDTLRERPGRDTAKVKELMEIVSKLSKENELYKANLEQLEKLNRGLKDSEMTAILLRYGSVEKYKRVLALERQQLIDKEIASEPEEIKMWFRPQKLFDKLMAAVNVIRKNTKATISLMTAASVTQTAINDILRQMSTLEQQYPALRSIEFYSIQFKEQIQEKLVVAEEQLAVAEKLTEDLAAMQVTEDQDLFAFEQQIVESFEDQNQQEGEDDLGDQDYS
jgi:hypothetical protein